MDAKDCFFELEFLHCLADPTYIHCRFKLMITLLESLLHICVRDGVFYMSTLYHFILKPIILLGRELASAISSTHVYPS